MDDERPIVDFNLPGFLGIVEKKGMEKAALQVIKDMLLMCNKILKGRTDK